MKRRLLAWIYRHPTATLRIVAGLSAAAFLNGGLQIVTLYGNVLLGAGLVAFGGLFLLVATSVEIEL